MFGQGSGGETSRLFIEDSEQNAGAMQLRIDQYSRAEQLEFLSPPLYKTSTQVNIENMYGASSYLYVGSRAATRLPPAISYVKVADGGYW